MDGQLSHGYAVASPARPWAPASIQQPASHLDHLELIHGGRHLSEAYGISFLPNLPWN